MVSCPDSTAPSTADHPITVVKPGFRRAVDHFRLGAAELQHATVAVVSDVDGLVPTDVQAVKAVADPRISVVERLIFGFSLRSPAIRDPGDRCTIHAPSDSSQWPGVHRLHQPSTTCGCSGP